MEAKVLVKEGARAEVGGMVVKVAAAAVVAS